MADKQQLLRHSIKLRFVGNDLQPAAITEALGAEPTRKGKWPEDPGVKTGHWILERVWQATEYPEYDIGVFGPKILELFGCLSKDLQVWRKISQRFPGDVLCHAGILNRAAVIFLDAEAITALSERNLRLTFVARE